MKLSEKAQREIIVSLSEYVGENGDSESAVEVLQRIIRERNDFRSAVRELDNLRRQLVNCKCGRLGGRS